MYLAVRLWRDTPDKPAGMPDTWPSDVRELGKLRKLPSPEWLLMTSEDYCRYVSLRRELYLKWAATNAESLEWKDPDVVEE